MTAAGAVVAMLGVVEMAMSGPFLFVWDAGTSDGSAVKAIGSPFSPYIAYPILAQ